MRRGLCQQKKWPAAAQEPGAAALTQAGCLLFDEGEIGAVSFKEDEYDEALPHADRFYAIGTPLSCMKHDLPR